jgi:hypothetical protein
MLRDVGHRSLELGRQRIDMPRRLGEQIEKLEPLTAAERGAYTRELLVQPLFEDPVCHVHKVLVRRPMFNSSIDKLTMHYGAHNVTSMRSPAAPKDRATGPLRRDGVIERDYRSAIGVSLLERAGVANLIHVADGLAGWQAAGGPVERSR